MSDKLTEIEDALDDVRHMVDLCLMACSDLTREQGAALGIVLDNASEKLAAIGLQLGAYRNESKEVVPKRK